jgi:hypothetical protein
MTHLDVAFRYGAPPSDREMRAVDGIKEVYGIRRITFQENDRTVRVEYDASRLNEAAVASLLRRAGVDLGEKVQLV